MSATGSRGFTLIEMLVVLAILGLIGGIGWPRLQQAVAAQAFRSAGSAVAATLREARARAVRSGRPVRVAASADGSRFGDDAGHRSELAAPATARTTPAAIVFYGDGSSSGGTAQVVADRRRLRFEIAPATGLFRIVAT